MHIADTVRKQREVKLEEMVELFSTMTSSIEEWDMIQWNHTGT